MVELLTVRVDHVEPDTFSGTDWMLMFTPIPGGRFTVALEEEKRI